MKLLEKGVHPCRWLRLLLGGHRSPACICIKRWSPPERGNDGRRTPNVTSLHTSVCSSQRGVSGKHHSSHTPSNQSPTWAHCEPPSHLGTQESCFVSLDTMPGNSAFFFFVSLSTLVPSHIPFSMISEFSRSLWWQPSWYWLFVLSTYIYMCVCGTCVCMCGVAHVGMDEHLHACGSQRLTLCVFFDDSLLYLLTGSREARAPHSVILVSQLVLESPSASIPWVWGFQADSLPAPLL